MEWLNNPRAFEDGSTAKKSKFSQKPAVGKKKDFSNLMKPNSDLMVPPHYIAGIEESSVLSLNQESKNKYNLSFRNYKKA